MRLRRLFALLAVVALIAVACGDSEETTTTTTAAPGTTTSTTEAETTTTTEGETTTTTEGETTTTTEGMTGPAFDVGFDEATGTIRLGVLAALTGPIPGIGQSVFDGHRVYWDKVNADGGVAGTYPVELVVRDNEYNPERTVVVYNEIKDDVLAFSSTLGTPTTAPIAGPAGEESILVAAGSLASQWALTENVLLNLAANTYFAQFANAPYWAMEIADPAIMTTDTVVGIVYQADDYGADCKNGYDFAQENLGFNAAYEATYAPTDTDFSAQMAGAQAGGVEVLFVCALPTALATMIGTNAALAYNPIIFGSSPSYNVALPAALGGGDEAAGLAAFANYYNLGTSVPWEADLPGAAQMRADRDAHGADVPQENINAFFYFGYTQAASFHQVLEAGIANGDITRAGLLSAVGDVQNVDFGFGGAPAGYGDTPAGRIPTNEDQIGTIVSVTERAFGIEPVSDFFVAPYMEGWDPAG